MSLLMSELSMFTGSDKVYNHRIAANLPQSVCRQSPYGPLKITYSEGVKHLAENGKCYWLIDAIASHLPTVAKNKDYCAMHFWFLHQKEDGKVYLECVLDSDAESMSKPLVSQLIEFTDFPFDNTKSFRLYAGATTMEGNVNVMNIYLPSEY